MLRSGMGESTGKEVKIDGISYEVFADIMAYLYSGHFVALDNVPKEQMLDKATEYLRVADSEYLDDVKQLCEQKLIGEVSVETFGAI